MSYRENYENWLNSPALSQEEKAELEAIRMDEKEIEFIESHVKEMA